MNRSEALKEFQSVKDDFSIIKMKSIFSRNPRIKKRVVEVEKLIKKLELKISSKQ